MHDLEKKVNIANCRTNWHIVLFKVWQDLKQQKVIFLVTFLLVVGLGIFFSLMRTSQYIATQFFKMPVYAVNEGKLVSVISVEAIAEKINKIYLPLEVAKYNILHNKNPIILTGNVIALDKYENDKQKNKYFSISLKGSYVTATVYKEIMQDIVQDLRLDTTDFFKNRIDYLNESAQLLQKRRDELFNSLNFLRTKDKGNQLLMIFFQRIYLDDLINLEMRIRDIEDEHNSLSSIMASSELIYSAAPGLSNRGLILLVLVLGLIVAGFVAIITSTRR